VPPGLPLTEAAPAGRSWIVCHARGGRRRAASITSVPSEKTITSAWTSRPAAGAFFDHRLKKVVVRRIVKSP